jgi:hypothetical protein
MLEYKVVDVRATGRAPEAVGADLERALNEASAQGWTYRDTRPIIYNSSTTGYFLILLDRENGEDAGAPGRGDGLDGERA